MAWPVAFTAGRDSEAGSKAAECLRTVEELLPALTPAERRETCGQLARLEALLRLDFCSPPARTDAEPEDRLLQVAEAAERLGISADSLYRGRYPFKVRLGRRRVGFSARGIEQFIRSRSGK